jgi:hypothetical protein
MKNAWIKNIFSFLFFYVKHNLMTGLFNLLHFRFIFRVKSHFSMHYKAYLMLFFQFNFD